MHLDTAIEHYEKSLEVNTGETPTLEAVRVNALGALTGIYSDPPVEDFETALSYAEELVKDKPDDIKNLYAMANLYEKFDRVDEAEATYMRVADVNAEDTKACGALAAFYNKPLWDDGAVWIRGEQGGPRALVRRRDPDLERCATLDPDDPSGYYKVATFFWDKAYRDPCSTTRRRTSTPI